MSGKVGLLGRLAGFAIKYPRLANGAMTAADAVTTASKTVANSNPVTFFLAHWKAICITLAVIAACVSAFIWVKHDEAKHFNAGFNQAQTQYNAQVIAANKQAALDQASLNLFKQKYDDLSKARQLQVVTVTKPIIERITREVQSAPVYRSCTLTDGVFNDIQAETAGVNASIDSSQR